MSVLQTLAHRAEVRSCLPFFFFQFQGSEPAAHFFTKLRREADLLLCVLLDVIHVVGGSLLGPLKEGTQARDGNELPLFDKNKKIHARIASLMSASTSTQLAAINL